MHLRMIHSLLLARRVPAVPYTRITTHARFNSGGSGGGGGGNVNFISEFMKSINRQIEEHPTFQKDVKLLNEKSTEVAESDTMKRAKEAVTATGKGASAVKDTVAFAATKVGEGVGAVLESTPVRVTAKVVGKVGETVAKAAEPILETKAAKTVASGINSIQNDLASKSPSAQYIEYQSPEQRQKMLEQRRKTQPRIVPVAANPEAGAAVVMAEETKWQKGWRDFYESNPLAQNLTRIGKSIEESENPTVERARDVMYRVGKWFDETEEAKCIRAFRMVDPTFRRDEFLAEAAQFVIPEILEGNLKGNLVPIKKWCNEKVFAEISASVGQQRVANLVSDCKLLDLSQVDIQKMMFLNEDKTLPVIILSFSTQEILLFRDKKSKEIKLGAEDMIDRARYVIAMTKDQCLAPDIPIDPETLGWRVISWSRAGGKF
ncbi:hypothetical protein BJ741DRAFT_715758 [Chytriomyces cf. hyalinus JEL632]|nr:hypothetical protein BJ741DRAFT_715758 [Chytriomyces cf. hyalinus JEL632]